jgi:hypothetical protein
MIHDLPPMKLAQEMTMEEKVKLLNTLFTLVRELELDGISSILLMGTEPVDDDYVKDGWGRIHRLSEEGELTAVGKPVSKKTGSAITRANPSIHVSLREANQLFSPGTEDL